MITAFYYYSLLAHFTPFNASSASVRDKFTTRIKTKAGDLQVICKKVKTGSLYLIHIARRLTLKHESENKLSKIIQIRRWDISE